ncbi:hypothetical protein JD844_018014 [Phrynosoma platyrhinos]|uniref:Uncharacterized protein n=1 Tax=Phrynosoma platyrhinos TaxID=52577 RepID=A0ABQ7SMV4_PHRPL|nr:hypothetical protein JD844_018014 [Phrynosoma platyrhinos]
MLRVGALMAMLLLLLGPVAAGSPLLGRLLVLREGWPGEENVALGHGIKYQQLSVATAKNGAYKTSAMIILDQSAQRRSSRYFKSFRKYLETPGKNGCLNCQQKNILKCIIFCKRKLYLIKSISIHNSRMYLETNKLILERESKSRKMWKSIMKNGKFQVKMNCLSILNVKIKPDTEIIELQIYVENKYIETESSLGYIALQANMVLKGEERCILKSHEVLEGIMELKLSQTILKLKQLIETGMLQKKRYTQNNDQILDCDKDREFSRENRNVYDKLHYGIFTDRKKAFNSEKKGQYMRFEKYGLSSQSFQWGTIFLIREKMKVWKWKTLTKICKLLFVDASIYQRNRDDVQRIFPTHKMINSNIQGKSLFALYRNKKLIGKWTGVQVQHSVTRSVFPTIEIAIGVYHGEFSSEFSPGKPSLHMTKLLKHLMQSSQRVKKCFNVTQKRHRMKSLKALMVRKHLDTEDNFRTFLYLYKCISNSPLLVERSKRSAEGETVPISVDVLKRLTSALIAGATIFGIAIFALALGACYLYDKRRQLGKFFDTVLNDGKSRKSRKTSKSIAPQRYTSSLSQNFHFAQPQESKNQTALAPAAEAYAKEESDFVTIKQIYSSSVSEVSSEVSLDHRSLTVRSRAYVSTSLSSQSIRSFCDDVCDVSSSQLSLSDEIKIESHISNPSRTIPKENESVGIVPQPESLCDNQEQCTSSDLLPQLKKVTDSSQLCLRGEITVENQFSNLSTTIPKEELIPVVPQPESLCDNQEQYTNSDGFLQPKKATDSSQLCLLGEITVENQCLNLSTTTLKEKELVPVVPQPECLCNNQEQCASSDLVEKTEDSSQLCLLGKMTVENQFLNLSTTASKEKELFPVKTQPEHSLCHNQEKCTSCDVPQLKRISISKSKSETDIRFSYSRMSHAAQSLTHIYKCP